MKELISENVILGPYTSWQIGGAADYFCLPKTVEELTSCWQWAQQSDMAMQILGGGSNVLVSDQGVSGLTICLKALCGFLETTRTSCEVLSGTSKSEILRFFLKEKLSPALFLAGIPGDVGGGVVMNAGVGENMEPREFCEIVEWIEVLKPDLSLQRYRQSQLGWHYRHSEGWQPGIITRVSLRWDHPADPAILDKVKQANLNRLAKQPLDKPSCGSVFRNPPGKKAAQLIDSAGLKGFSVGAAQVSPKHANFIVNNGQATAAQIWEVIRHVQEVVLRQHGVSLQTEVVLMGRW